MQHEDFCRQANLKSDNRTPISSVRVFIDHKFNALGRKKSVERVTHIISDMVKF